jgi:hypothetical protein
MRPETPLTHGTPYSRATMAACEVGPPVSVTTARATAKPSRASSPRFVALQPKLSESRAGSSHRWRTAPNRSVFRGDACRSIGWTTNAQDIELLPGATDAGEVTGDR